MLGGSRAPSAPRSYRTRGSGRGWPEPRGKEACFRQPRRGHNGAVPGRLAPSFNVAGEPFDCALVPHSTTVEFYEVLEVSGSRGPQPVASRPVRVPVLEP